MTWKGFQFSSGTVRVSRTAVYRSTSYRCMFTYVCVYICIYIYTYTGNWSGSSGGRVWPGGCAIALGEPRGYADRRIYRGDFRDLVL